MTQRWETFGDLLRHLRVAAGLTQEDLAERAGLSVRGVSDLERGRNRFPYRATVLRLIEVLQPPEGEIETLWTLSTRRPRAQGPERATSSPRLPLPLTGILGREEETARLLHLLRWEGVRLLTITGPGGVGKTRLALQVAAEAARDYADGVTFVSLAAISDPRLVPTTIAAAVNAPISATVSTEEALLSHLADREHLLVLDNFEQIVSAGPFVAEMLIACPTVKAVVTSRSPLHIRGEQQFDLRPLVFPALGAVRSADDLTASPATALFLERARAAVSSLTLSAADAAAVAEICRRLDGLPLAIELAAAHVKYESPRLLLAQLDGRLDVLSGRAQDLPVRQRTLRATIDWSYQLLPGEARKLFRCLAVFRGSIAVETVVDVCGSDEMLARQALHALHDASLVVLDPGGAMGSRVRMLDTVQSFARELLQAGDEAPPLRDQHLGYFVRLAEEAEPHLTSAEQADWLARMSEERDNIRGALHWASRSGRQVEAIRVLIALRVLWEAHGPLGEAIGWLESLLASAHDALQGDPRLWARALGTLGRLYQIQSQDDRAEATLNEALSHISVDQEPALASGILNNLASISHERDDYSRAIVRYEKALQAAIVAGDRWFTAAVYTNLGNLLSDTGELDRAQMYLEHALSILRDLGERRIEGMNLNVLGEVYRLRGNGELAAAAFRRALRLLHEVTDWGNLAYSLDCLARVACDQGLMERAAQLIGAADGMRGPELVPGEDVDVSRKGVLARCAGVLGDDAVASLRARGAAMSVEALVTFALEERTSRVSGG